MLKAIPEMIAFRDEIKASGFTDAVVLGMGGSSLAPDVLRATFQPPPPTPSADGCRGGAGLRLHVLDTTDPTTVHNLERQLDLSKTLFIVSSKSGATVEVNSFYKYFRAKIDVFAADTAGQHFIAITDEGTALQSLAGTEGFRRVFRQPRRYRRALFGAVVFRLAARRAGRDRHRQLC